MALFARLTFAPISFEYTWLGGAGPCLSHPDREAWERDRKKLRKALLDYCGQDTLAMEIVDVITAYDILAYQRSCPSLDHAATVFVELGEVLSDERLAALMGLGAKVAVLQRVGWLLDFVGWREKTGRLHDALQKKRLQWHSLDSRTLFVLPRRVQCVRRWEHD